MGFTDRPQTLRWRRALFQVHLWTGLLVGAYVILICLTGSLLVFQQRMMNDAPRLGQDTVHGWKTYGDLVAAAQKAYPDGRLDNIDMRTANRRVVSIGLQEPEYSRVVYVDSVSGRIVGEEIPQKRHALLELAEALHNQLASGMRGGVWNGIGGLLLFAISITGIILWWPGRRNWKRSLKVKWDARWPRLIWDLHSAFGFWSLPLVAMWALSGAYFIFPNPFLRALASVSPPAAPQTASLWQPGDSILPIDALMDEAKRLYPRDHMAYAYMDTLRPDGTVKFFLSPDPAIPLTLREDVIAFQPATGSVLSNSSSLRWSLGERISNSIYAVHFGNFGGLFIEIVWSMLGLVPVLLTLTGYGMWWNRVLKKRWHALFSVR